MRILIFTGVFFPSVGGMETVTDTMAREFVRLGHDVRLITPAGLGGEDARYDERFPYPVLRAPSAAEQWRQMRWCDVYYQSNPSAKAAWPLAFLRRPWVIEHMLWRFGDEPGGPTRARAKLLLRFLGRAAWHLAGSRAVARALPFHADYVPTPFRSGEMRLTPDVPRDRDVVFAGRVMRSKGVQTLLAALAALNARGRRYTATVVGHGQDADSLRAECAQLGLDPQVEFAGLKKGDEFVRLLNRHRVMAVPSVAYETFGAVACEGIACGCAVVASDAGGLPDAVGPCGVIVPRGDVAALAAALEQLLEHPDELARCRARADEHLAQFRQDVAAEARLDAFRRALGTA